MHQSKGLFYGYEDHIKLKRHLNEDFNPHENITCGSNLAVQSHSEAVGQRNDERDQSFLPASVLVEFLFGPIPNRSHDHPVRYLEELCADLVWVRGWPQLVVECLNTDA